MNILRRSLALCAFIGAMGYMTFAYSADTPESSSTEAPSDMAVPKAEGQTVQKEDAHEVTVEEAKETHKDIVLKGDAKCTSCHDEADSPELLSIGKTRHGTLSDNRSPTCTNCHGESKPHLLNPEHTKIRPKPDLVFSGKRIDKAEDRNGVCLECHQKDAKRSHWEGSTHQTRDVACTSCHEVHTAHDKVRDKRTQPDVCFTCHMAQRAQINLLSYHPVPEGKMAYSDCHNPHGSIGSKLMKRDSVNETCYTCHMEKRGPFVHEHEPVSEDCSICHNPHGATTENLLKMRPPFLCQSCHTPHGAVQPLLAGQVAPPGSIGWWNGSTITQGGGCTNCHSQIHGSNNPGLANPAPQNYFR